MKITIAQTNPIAGDIKANTNNIISSINKFKNLTDVIIFPEMSLTGYPVLDLLFSNHFIPDVEKNLDRIIKVSNDITIILGLPRKSKGLIYNSAIIIQNCKVLGYRDKTHLPSYDVFNEKRYFKSAKTIEPIDILIKDRYYKFGIEICEDLWDDIYDIDVTSELIQKGSEIIVNISASPFQVDRVYQRHAKCYEKVKGLKYFFIYVNMVGAQDELVFDGSSFIMDSNKKILKQCNSFEEQFSTFDSDLDNTKEEILNKNVNHQIFGALKLGVSDYFKKSGFTKGVIGISGGIDSALTATIAAQAIGSKNLMGVMMPTIFTSKNSIKDAKELAKRLKIQFKIIQISDLFNNLSKQIENSFNVDNSSLTNENLQARIRANILMAIANNQNALLFNTGNKTEMGLGYCTIYGDMCGAISVIGDLNKIQVYSLSKWINKTFSEIPIPLNITSKKPSAELRLNQYDPFDYEVVSPLVDEIVNNRRSKSELIKLGYDSKLVTKILDLVRNSEYKRKQSPPGIKISTKAFGIGRRFPIINKYKD